MKAPFIPKAFEEKYRSLLGNEFEPFLECCRQKSPRTVRPNGFKCSAAELKTIFESHHIELQPHSSFENVFSITTPNVRLGLLPEHREGLFVVQDVSSMVPAMVLDPKPEETVLDLAAAPGMKTVQMAELMQNKGAIVAVDANKLRLKGLRFNLNRLGVINALVVNADGRFFRPRILFDKVLLDAPCSSEGVIRKRLDALKGWSQRLVENKSKLQKQLIQNAFSLLRPQGELVYSTCTFAPEENEVVIQQLLDKHANAQLEKIEIPDFKLRSGLSEFNRLRFSPEMKRCIRVFPQDNDSEAFFVAKIKKVVA